MFFGALLEKSFENTINEAGQEAFTEAIEIGISNTIKAQIDSDVVDDKIIKTLEKYWGISHDEAIRRIVHCKKSLVMDAISEYYQLKGYSSDRARSIWISKAYGLILIEKPDLWPLWKNPDKLVAAFDKESQKINSEQNDI